MLTLLLSLSLSWGAKSHRSIVNGARKLLLNDGHKSAYEFYSNDKQLLNKLLEGCVDPDKLENAGGTHYYVYDSSKPNKGQYYRNALIHKTKDTARTQLEKHYLYALKNFSKGDIETSILELGRSCHYLGDISCPPHAAGIQYPILPILTNYHKLFEDHAKIVMTSGESKYHAKTANKNYGDFDANNYAVSINELCRLSASQKDKVKTMDESKWEEGIAKTSVYGEIYTAVLLEKFYRDVNEQ